MALSPVSVTELCNTVLRYKLSNNRNKEELRLQTTQKSMHPSISHTLKGFWKVRNGLAQLILTQSLACRIFLMKVDMACVYRLLHSVVTVMWVVGMWVNLKHLPLALTPPPYILKAAGMRNMVKVMLQWTVTAVSGSDLCP